jgi:6-phosphogluconolactonase
MQFVQKKRETMEAELTNEIKTALKKGTVTFVVPGGSNIPSVVRVLDGIGIVNSENLTLLLSDERFGPINHPDSNYFQLMNAGLKMYKATFVETLTGSTLESTVTYYEASARKLLMDADTVIAFLGMGADGHIAGILPHSPAAQATDVWAVSYAAKEFQRVTLTPFALSHISCAFVGAYGPEKAPALRKLKDTTLPITDQPAQLLKHLPNVTIYNNELGD